MLSSSDHNRATNVTALRLVRESAETLMALDNAVVNARTALDTQDRAIAITCQGSLSPVLSKQLYTQLTGNIPAVRKAMVHCLQALVYLREVLDDVGESSQELLVQLEHMRTRCDEIEAGAHSQLARTSTLTRPAH